MLFAFLVGCGIAGHVFLTDLDHREPFVQILLKSAGIVILTFTFIMLAYVSGGRRFYKGDIKVSPWFGAFVGGAPLVFFAGAAYWDDLYRGGFMALAIWGVFLLWLSIIKSFIRRHRTKDLEHCYQKDHIKNAQSGKGR